MPYRYSLAWLKFPLRMDGKKLMDTEAPISVKRLFVSATIREEIWIKMHVLGPP